MAKRNLSRRLLIALAGTAISTPGAAFAQSLGNVVLSGDYLKIGVNDKGALGVGGNTSPGILYDGTGTGTFNSAYDYLTPGTPMEAFVLKGQSSGGGFTATNDNASLGAASISGTLTSYNGAAYNGTTYDQRAVWTGTYGSLFTITHDYHFNTHGQQLLVTTTIEALADLSDLAFVRLTDPDARAAPGDASMTNNFRGSGSIPTTDLVYAEALASKYVIGIYSNDATPHVTGVPGFTHVPDGYLNETFLGNGDYTIGMGFTIGGLANGASKTLTYSYIFGTDIAAAVSAGVSSPAPAPAPTTIQSGGSYSVDQLQSGGVQPVFDGGVLTLNGDGKVTSAFEVRSGGGGIDTGGHELALSGVLSGPGAITKLGEGVLTLSGENDFHGVNLRGGVLAITASSAVGASDGVITFDGGALRVDDNIALSNPISIPTGGTIDTGVKNLVLTSAISGAGILHKTGAGDLTLAGSGDQSVLDVQGGRVILASDKALGAPAGTIFLGTGAGLVTAAPLTINQNIQVTGAGATFDTAGQSVTLSGSLTGDACFIKTGAGRLNLTGGGANPIGACVQQGQLAFNSAFAGNVFVSPGATLSGGGSIRGNIALRGSLSPGNSPGRLVVAGSVLQDSGAVLDIDVDGPTPGVGAGHYDTVVVTGANSIYSAAGTIAPHTRGITGDATNTYTPRIGDTFQVVTAEGGVTGAFASVTQPTDGMPANSRFEVLYTPNAIVLAVTPDRYAALDLGSRNARSVAAAADRIRDAGGDAFTAGLVGRGPGEVGLVLQQAAGEINADVVDAALHAHRAAGAEIGARLDGRVQPERSLWGAVVGDTRRVGADANAAGYSAERRGGVLGLDSAFGAQLRFGGALSYAETSVSAGAMGSGRVASYGLHAYGAWRSAAYHAAGVISGGTDVYRAERAVALSTGTLAAARPHGSNIALDVEAGRDERIGPALVTLAGGLAADRVRRDATTESGDAAARLNLGKASRDSVQARLGARVRVEHAVGAWVLSPYASAFVAQELADPSAHLTAALDGQAFEVRAAEVGRTALKLETGLAAQLSRKARMSVDYRYEGARGALGHTVALTGALAW